MEWPVVILPWLVNGIFPSQKAVEEDNLDEERRLFYVALTRAKERLFLFDAKMRKAPSGGLYGVDPSVFLTEIPKTLIEERIIRKPFDPSSASPYGGWGAGYRRDGSSYGGSSSYGSSFRRGGTSTTTTWRR
jgi:DNA helicase-2/ATP-dependent DNA helicase PcrA